MVEEFHRDYEDAWRELQMAKETCETAGWLAFYANEVQDQRKQRQEIAQAIERHVESFKTWGSNEDSEKELGELKKQEIELREHVEGWRARVVRPMRSRVDRCNSVLSTYLSKAQDIARESPLLHKDAEPEMREAQCTHPRAAWIEEDGRIEIVDPRE